MFDLKKMIFLINERNPNISNYNEWLRENNIKYRDGWISANDPRVADYYIQFFNSEDMMAFKLWME